ncbi:diguanylate cyclase domain-containing protein [Caenimonas koreensis]|uniref:diguanylate cyclase domain-containing protein n=1 Tax=Caenimonas koreensis TaxID=367474 RepID=UPI003782E67F
MDAMAVGFWGAYFGTVGLLLAGSIAAFARSLQRVAVSAALFALISAIYFAAYLDWIALGEQPTRLRWLSQISVASAAVLASTVLAMLGVLRNPRRGRLVRISIGAATLTVIGIEWLLTPDQALALGSAITISMAFAMLYVCIRSAERGDRLAWWAVTGVSFMILAIAGLSVIARNPPAAPLWVHAVSAVSGMFYVSVMATALWIRYSYLIELRQVVTHGPSYDPITRMRSHSETGQMVGLAFFGHAKGDTRPVGVIAVAIGNFYMLEQLHGRAAVNHALFVCGNRLRRCVPGQVETGRLGDDGFLLLVRGFRNEDVLAELAATVAERLARPVTLSTSAAPADLEAGRAYWEAQVGVGVVAAQPGQRPSQAITTARDMARTAWTYPSRVAKQEPGTGAVVEVLGFTAP